ncbi:rRNA maturation RNase YbeY [Pseudothauera nasutitermitis]|uniref:Endoribonuclease YbeY n=1 Tax=Pseudothauera nasutitermitis TaxID=2565930 RepID=A0A4S4AUV6_9RHOO|nr:rRNA maturation RNase YbeY [Pseudothauera nasutitermitis]THF63777.1 rRNA maturation RNase YbeY [Pseudothauera nasutitermitis]
MAKNPETRIVAYDADGKPRRIAAERLEIDLGRGRRVVIDFPAQAWGDLDIEAQSDEGTPFIGVLPGACNLLTLRVDAHHDAAPVELGELPAPAHEPELALTVQKALGEADKAFAPRKHRIRRWARAALRRDAEVTVRLVGEEEGRALNRDYRGKDYATNVLTFVYGEGLPAEAAAGAPLAGDLVLCVPVVAREAAAQGKDLEAHYAHLVVHGMLHLQGYDHDADTDAAAMEALETEILAALGYPDPYA